MTRNFPQLAVGLPLYQSHGVASKGFIELAGAGAAEGVRLPGTALLVADQLAGDDPQKPVVAAYISEYEAAYGEAPSTFGGYAHDAFAILVDAIARAGSSRAGGDPRRDRGDLGPRRDDRRRDHDARRTTSASTSRPSGCSRSRTAAGRSID